MNLKNVLISLSSVAGLLGLITFYVVFYANTGTYVVNSDVSTNTVFSSSTITLNTSTPSSTLAFATSTIINTSSSNSGENNNTGGTGNISSSGQYASNYVSPPVTWTEGSESFAITNASLSGSQLTLQVQINMGSLTECVPLDIKMVTDENGDVTGPLSSHYTFPDSGTCIGTAGETYTDQQVVFNVDPSTMPVVFNATADSSVVFEVGTNKSGGLNIELPPNAG